MIPLWVEQGAPGWGAWTYDAATFVIQNPTYLWWPDKLRLEKLLPSPNVFACPALIQPATEAHGQAATANSTLGIGMNYPEYGHIVPAAGNADPVYSSAIENQVTSPSQSIVFADAAYISNPDERLRQLGGRTGHRLRLFPGAERCQRLSERRLYALGAPAWQTGERRVFRRSCSEIAQQRHRLQPVKNRPRCPVAEEQQTRWPIGRNHPAGIQRKGVARLKSQPKWRSAAVTAAALSFTNGCRTTT